MGSDQILSNNNMYYYELLKFSILKIHFKNILVIDPSEFIAVCMWYQLMKTTRRVISYWKL